jgi:hypothetical protein
MDLLPVQYGYRCLPLTIANTHGWDLICPAGFSARWNGAAVKDAITVECDDPDRFAPVSHFGSGILTMHPGYLFRTDPDFNLWVGGPINEQRHGIAALTGVVETDWSPHGFTVNWLFTAPDVTVRFEAGDAFCTIFPIPRGYLDAIEPEIWPLESDVDFKDQHTTWQESRKQFLIDLPDPKSQAHQDKWQKGYYRGQKPDGTPGTDSHQIKLRLKEPVDRRG